MLALEMWHKLCIAGFNTRVTQIVLQASAPPKKRGRKGDVYTGRGEKLTERLGVCSLLIWLGDLSLSPLGLGLPPPGIERRVSLLTEATPSRVRLMLTVGEAGAAPAVGATVVGLKKEFRPRVGVRDTLGDARVARVGD